jgi:uncharacterized protein (TIGR02001 family)
MGAFGASQATAADFDGFLALTSDYIYRGASQTGHEPAIQADAHYYDPGGWLAGVWGSNVRLHPDESTGVEIDPYLGFAHALGTDWSARFAAVYHAYVGNNPGSRYHYSELSTTLVYRSQWFLTAVVSPDTEVDTSAYTETRRVALSGDLAWHRSLGRGLSVNLGAGYYRLRRPNADGYGYGSAGLGYERGPFYVDLALIGVSAAARDFYSDGEAVNRLIGTVLWRF